MSGEQIALPWDGRYMLFDVERLQTAMLILMDLPDEPHSLKRCAAKLRDDFGFERADYILYPVGARIALDRGILLE